jgi:hypothetical protein
LTCEHQKHFHTSQLLSFFLAATNPTFLLVLLFDLYGEKKKALWASYRFNVSAQVLDNGDRTVAFRCADNGMFMNMATVLQEFDGRQRPFCTEPGKENILEKYANHEGYEKVA